MEGDDIENGGEREGVGGGERVLMMNREISGIDYSLRLRPHDVDDNESQWTSWLVPLIVLANAVMFVVVMSVNNCPKHKHHSGCVPKFLGRFSFEPVSENPLFGPSSLTLRKLGALEHTDLVYKHQAWRLLSCIWLHAGFVHLLVNLLSLVFIGIRLEQQFGFVRFALIYILSGYGGSVFSSLLVHKFVSVGASGALFGLLGAMLSELITNWTTYTNKVAALLTLMFIAGINLVVGIMPHVSNVANVGGFLTGFFLGFVLLLRPQIGWLPQSNPADNAFDKIKYQLHQNVLRLVALLLLIIWLVVGTVMLFRGKKGNVLNV